MRNLCLLTVCNILLVSTIGVSADSYSWTLKDRTVGHSICMGSVYKGIEVCLSCRTMGKCTTTPYEADSPSYCPDSKPYCTYDEDNKPMCVVDPPVGENFESCNCSANIALECSNDPYQGQAYTDCRNQQIGIAHMLCPSVSSERESSACDCGFVPYTEADCVITSNSVLMKDFPCNGTYLDPDVYGCKYYFTCYGSKGSPSFYPTKCFGDSCFDRDTCSCVEHPLEDCPATCPYKVNNSSRPDEFCSCVPDEPEYVGQCSDCSNGGIFDNSIDGCSGSTNCVCYDDCDKVENYSTEKQNDYYNCVEGKPSGSVKTCPGEEGLFDQEQCTCSGSGISTSISPTTSTVGSTVSTSMSPTSTVGSDVSISISPTTSTVGSTVSTSMSPTSTVESDVSTSISPTTSTVRSTVSSSMSPTSTVESDVSTSISPTTSTMGSVVSTSMSPTTSTVATSLPPSTPTSSGDCPACGFKPDPENSQCFFNCIGGNDTRSCCPEPQIFIENLCQCHETSTTLTP